MWPFGPVEINVAPSCHSTSSGHTVIGNGRGVEVAGDGVVGEVLDWTVAADVTDDAGGFEGEVGGFEGEEGGVCCGVHYGGLDVTVA